MVHRNPKGLSARTKMFWQTVIAALALSYLAYRANLPQQTDLIVPFFKTVAIPLGTIGFIVLGWFVVVGFSNAVNLTDGLDGLANMPTVMVAGALAICGSTPIRPKCSWVTSARWHSAAHWD